MKLIDWMKREGVTDDDMVDLVGGVTIFAVRKWKYGERTPEPVAILRIDEVTKGDVSLRDWVDAQTARSEHAS